MSSRRALGRSSVAAVSGNLAYSVLQAATLAVITRTSNGAVDAGQFLLAQAVATPIAMLVGGKARDQFATEAHRSKFWPRVRRIIVGSLLLGSIGTVGWILVADGPQVGIGIGVLWANLAQATTTAYQGRVIRARKFWTFGGINATLGVLSLASILVGYELGGLVLGCGLLAGSWSLYAAVVTIAEAIRDRSVIETGDPVSSVTEDLQIGLAATSSIAQPSIIRIVTGSVAGPEALARFGSASQFTRLGSLVMSGVKAAVSPAIGEALASGTIRPFVSVVLRRTRLALVPVCAIATAGGWFLGPGIVTLVFSSSVRPSSATAAALFGAAPLLYVSMLLNQIAIALNEARALLRQSVIGLTFTAIVVYPAVSEFGATGAALVLGAGHGLRFLLLDRLLVSSVRE